MGFWTRVRPQSGPLPVMYANTFPIVAYKNLFGFAVPFDYYETEQEMVVKAFEHFGLIDRK